MICPQCQHENPANARYCMQCGRALQLVCGSCGSSLPVTARFCLQCGQSLHTRSASDEDRHTRLTAAAPAPLLAKARQTPILVGERRTVTILYVDVVDSTSLAARVGPTRWTALLNHLFDSLAPAIYRYEGTVARLLDDSMWAFFGLPIAHEDDPVRAVRAALDIRETAASLATAIAAADGITLQIRTCIHLGPIVVNAVGHDLKYEFAAHGGAVNVAARLKFAADPMTTVVSGQVHRFVAPLFDAAEKGHIDVPGQPEAIRVHEVRGLKAQPAPTRGLLGLHSRMVGRDQELSALLNLAQTVRAGLGRAVVVSGEPGVGKTRLIAEWQAALDAAAPPNGRFHWIVGHSRSYGQGMPYHLLASAVQNLLDVPETADDAALHAAVAHLTAALFPADTAADVATYLAHLLALPLDAALQEKVDRLEPQALQTRYRQALRRLLAALAARRPLALVLEDLHWADPSSADLLIDLLPLLADAPILFCLVTRPEQDAPGWRLVTAARHTLGSSLAELSLGALTADDSRELIANLLQIEALPDDVRQLILQKTEGNPFFVEEVIRMLIERQAIVRENGGWTAVHPIHAVDIPDNLQGLLMARIDRLPDEVRQTLRVAAVIGRQFPLKVLARVLGESTHDAAQ